MLSYALIKTIKPSDKKPEISDTGLCSINEAI